MRCNNKNIHFTCVAGRWPSGNEPAMDYIFIIASAYIMIPWGPVESTDLCFTRWRWRRFVIVLKHGKLRVWLSARQPAQNAHVFICAEGLVVFKFSFLTVRENGASWVQRFCCLDIWFINHPSITCRSSVEAIWFKEQDAILEFFSRGETFISRILSLIISRLVEVSVARIHKGRLVDCDLLMRRLQVTYVYYRFSSM